MTYSRPARTLTALLLGALIAAGSAGSVPGAGAVAADNASITNAEAAQMREGVSVDASELEAAVQRAKAAGVTVTQRPTDHRTIPGHGVNAAREDIQRQYQAKISELNALADKHTKATQAYEAARRSHEELVRSQTTTANPSRAIVADKLAFDQPFDFLKNSNSFHSIHGAAHTAEAGGFIVGDKYNSAKVYRVPVTNTSTFTVLWNNVAVDKASGRKLNATIRVSEVVSDSLDYGGSFIGVYSNFLDNLSLYNVTSVKQQVTYTYADTGARYEKPFYINIGSLNAQDGNRYEYVAPSFASPGHGVRATFLSRNSQISSSPQPVQGSGARGTRQAFMVPLGKRQTIGVSDQSPQAMTVLGITFFVNNGASFTMGVSGNRGANPRGNKNYYASYNHVMMSTSTIAPVAKTPAPPTSPKVDFNLTRLETPVPVTTKTADKEGMKVLAGDTTTQTVQHSTGYKAATTFVLGDNIHYTDDGRLPVSVDLSTVTVTGEDGADVTEGFDISAEDAEVNGKRVHQIRATAKRPEELKLNHRYSLHISQTALHDGIADTLIDSGFSIVNDVFQHTEDHSYPEPVIEPHKKVTDSTGDDINEQRVIPGSELRYVLTLNAKDLADTHTELTTLGLEDDYDETKWTPAKDKVTITDSDGKPVDPAQFAFTWDEANGKVVIHAKNPSALAGKDYTVTLPGTVRAGAAPEEFENTALQITNEQRNRTETVKNFIPVDLKLDKTATGEVTADGRIEYTLTVKNAGRAEARDVVVTDHGGSGILRDTITLTDPPEGTRVNAAVWTIPSLGAGETRTIKATAKIDPAYAGKPIVNKATVTSPDDPFKGRDPKCQTNSGVDADTDGCDAEETLVPVKPVPKKLRTGNAGHMGLDPASTAAVVGIGGVLLASAGGLWAVLARPRRGSGAEETV